MPEIRKKKKNWKKKGSFGISANFFVYQLKSKSADANLEPGRERRKIYRRCGYNSHPIKI